VETFGTVYILAQAVTVNNGSSHDWTLVIAISHKRVWII